MALCLVVLVVSVAEVWYFGHAARSPFLAACGGGIAGLSVGGLITGAFHRRTFR
jgi:hypothetical protein